MAKITNISLQNLDHDSHIGFVSEIVQVAQGDDNVLDIARGQVEVVASALESEKSYLEAARQMAYAFPSQVNEKLRDELFRSLYNVIIAYAGSPLRDDIASWAGDTLKKIRAYGLDMKSNKQKRTEAISKLLTDIKTEVSRPVVATLGIENILVALEDTNNKVDAYLRETPSVLSMMATAAHEASRTFTDRVYQNMMIVVEANIITGDSERYEPFAEIANEIIDKWEKGQ